MTPKELRRAIEMLGFDPCTKEREWIEIEVTPEMAQYILDNHNNDNRKIVPAQVQSIKKYFKKHGWLHDGNTMTFTHEGNILECQHRLMVIVDENITVKIMVALGVDPEVFTQTAPAKARNVGDVINRQDKTVSQTDVAMLRQLIKWRGQTKIIMPNALSYWYQYKDFINQAKVIIDDYFDGTTINWEPWRRQFGAWAALMIFTGNGKHVKPFLKMLKEYELQKQTPILLVQMEDWFMKHTAYLSAANKAEAVRMALCTATDKFMKQTSGDIHFDLNNSKANHDSMSKNGIYRKFLFNPNNIEINHPDYKTLA